MGLQNMVWVIQQWLSACWGGKAAQFTRLGSSEDPFCLWNAGLRSCWNVNETVFCCEQLVQKQYRSNEQQREKAGRWKLPRLSSSSHPYVWLPTGRWCPFWGESPSQFILPGNTFRNPRRGMSLSWSQMQSKPRLILTRRKWQSSSGTFMHI